MTVIDDFVAEGARLQSILGLLTEAQWLAESGAGGWSVADVVLHLAQSDEGVVASADGAGPGEGVTAAGTVDDWAARMVDAERGAPAQVFTRWRQARDAAAEALRAADPQVPLEWVTGPVKPATLATTRLAEYWAHGLDITGPLGIDFPDTSRLRHIAWLAHRTLPYAFSLAGETPAAVRCSLTAPDGVTTWTFGPDDAESGISGCDLTRRTSSCSALTWSSTTLNRCQEASWPAEAPTRSRSSAWLLEAIAQRVWGTTMTRETFSRCTPRTRASSAASVTRPPGLRKILASPARRPTIRSGSMRESMQVTIATPAWAIPSKPPSSKCSAKSLLAVSRSSKSTAQTVSEPLSRPSTPRSSRQWLGMSRTDRAAPYCPRVSP